MKSTKKYVFFSKPCPTVQYIIKSIMKKKIIGDLKCTMYR